MSHRLFHRASSSVLCAGSLLLGLALSGSAYGQAAPAHPTTTTFNFDFGAAKAAPGHTPVLPDMAYTNERGFGFESGASVQAVHRAAGDLISSNKTFLFSVAVPEGNYQVTATLGDPEGESQTTIKAEIRRLMVEKAHLDKGKTATYTFNVAVRTPQIAGGGVVRLKPRETTSEIRAWDEKLTLEFDDSHPCISNLTIKKVDDLPVIFVCGDSTICDQPGENFASWGQMLPRFFKPDVVVANHGESGESLRGFLGEKRWDKVLSLMKKGDYMIVQMGHNDEKESGPNIGALTSFKTDLKRFVADTRAKGATPIIVSPMERRSFDEAGKQKLTHGDYPLAFRQVAQEDKVAFVDLTALSAVFYNTLGADKAYLAFAGTGTQRDATHHNNYGAYELAKIVVQGLKDNKVDLAQYIVDDFKGFDPAKPDPVDTFSIPAGPSTFNLRPLGN